MNKEGQVEFTGFLRFRDERQDVGMWILDRVGGKVNLFGSPFPEDKRLIYRITRLQYERLRPFLDQEEVEMENVEWPKDKGLPPVFLPGYW